jgi:hypothetical protein
MWHNTSAIYSILAVERLTTNIPFRHFSVFEARQNILLLMIDVKRDFRNTNSRHHLHEPTQADISAYKKRPLFKTKSGLYSTNIRTFMTIALEGSGV